MENMIMWLSIIWLPVLIYFVLRNEAKFKKNISVGVTLPYDARKDEEVLAHLQRFKRSTGLICALLIVLGLAASQLGSSLSMALWGVWVLLAIVLPYVPYVRCNLALARLKAARGWSYAEKQTVTVDTDVIRVPKPLPDWLFLPPLLVSLLPLLWERDMFVLYLVEAIFVVLSWAGNRWLLRRRAERVDDNAELTAVLTQLRRRNWGRLWLLVAWCLALVSPISAFSMEKPLLMGVLFAALMVVLLAAALWIEFHLRRLQEKLTENSGRGSYVDEDDKWIWGMFYYNKNDAKLLVNSRVGSNSSINLAHPAGKLIMGCVLVILLLIPLMFPVMESSVGAPVLEISGDVLDGGKYELPLAEIAQVELLSELPKGLIRVAGTSMPNRLSGRFTASGTGKLLVSIDPTDGPWLLVTMQDGGKYLLGSSDGDNVEAIFAQLN